MAVGVYEPNPLEEHPAASSLVLLFPWTVLPEHRVQPGLTSNTSLVSAPVLPRVTPGRLEVQGGLEDCHLYSDGTETRDSDTKQSKFR